MWNATVSISMPSDLRQAMDEFIEAERAQGRRWKLSEVVQTALGEFLVARGALPSREA